MEGMESTYKDIRENGWSPLAPASLVAFSVMIATFMEVLDSTIVNVSLPHIAGSLSAGSMASWEDGTAAKSLHVGLAASGGVQAAAFARQANTMERGMMISAVSLRVSP